MLERARHVAPVQINAIVDPPRECTVLCQRPSLSLYFAKLNKNLHQPKCGVLVGIEVLPPCNWLRQETKYSVSTIQLRINQLVEVLRLISSGVMNCVPPLEREILKPIRRTVVHPVRNRPAFVTLFAK